MPARRLLLLFLCCLAAALPARAERADSVARLDERLQRLRAGRIVLDERVAVEMRGLVADLRLIWAVDPEREAEVARCLLDVMGAFLGAESAGQSLSNAAELRELAQDALRARVDTRFAAWLAREIVAPQLQPIDRRLAAMRLLHRQTQPAVRLALLSCTQEKEPRLRREALASLAGWYDPAVHAVFLRELQRELSGDAAAEGALAEQHFAQVAADPDHRFLAELEPIVKSGLVSARWRTAARAAALSRPLANEAILPHLIEALSLWRSRGPDFGNSLRMQLEIGKELRRRSGRSLGLDPETWRRWWAAVRSGAVPHTSGGMQPPPAEETRASFFGLRPTSDRIVFVLDRSKSMEGAFGPSASGGRFRRRWDEAVAQLESFLEASGPACRFDVVLFHDYAQAWKGGELVPADAENRRKLREWLATQVPNGGTQLRMGVDAALQIDRHGVLHLDRLEADTVLVLCDGETAEGSGWVRAFLEQANAAARVVFHGVQIGGTSDGTLEALAGGSGGEFVPIEG